MKTFKIKVVSNIYREYEIEAETKGEAIDEAIDEAELEFNNNKEFEVVTVEETN